MLLLLPSLLLSQFAGIIQQKAHKQKEISKFKSVQPRVSSVVFLPRKELSLFCDQTIRAAPSPRSGRGLLRFVVAFAGERRAAGRVGSSELILSIVMSGDFPRSSGASEEVCKWLRRQFFDCTRTRLRRGLMRVRKQRAKIVWAWYNSHRRIVHK